MAKGTINPIIEDYFFFFFFWITILDCNAISCVFTYNRLTGMVQTSDKRETSIQIILIINMNN